MTEAGRAALFPTCVVDTVAPQVGAAAVRVLRRLGFAVSVPERATCCGQPAWNAGFVREAATVAATTLDALDADDADVVCVPAGSCATMIRVFWPELFHLVGDAPGVERARRVGSRVQELSELVHERGGIEGRYEARVAYHHSCHMLRELRLHDEPLSALERLEGCTLVRWAGDERCCGFGGLFSVKQPETSVAMADDKLDEVLAAQPDALVGSDSSCLLHLEGRLRRRGERMPVRHLAEVLDAASPGDSDLSAT